MNLVDALGNYIKGQFEVQNPDEKTIYKGKIRNLSIDKQDLIISLYWKKRGIGYPPEARDWVRSYVLDPKTGKERKDLEYVAALEIFKEVEVSNDRIILMSPVINDILTLTPKIRSNKNFLRMLLSARL
ncbi:hypothetical protein GOV12_03760 [Candidatus Pacearchaeota archaeon]|nr:hypothetical protein [Candidatus Pacearchaeota archaeon]